MLFVQADSKGSSVDPEVKHMVVQQSGKGQNSAPAQTSAGNKESKANKDNTNSNTRAEPPPKR